MEKNLEVVRPAGIVMGTTHDTRHEGMHVLRSTNETFSRDNNNIK